MITSSSSSFTGSSVKSTGGSGAFSVSLSVTSSRFLISPSASRASLFSPASPTTSVFSPSLFSSPSAAFSTSPPTVVSPSPTSIPSLPSPTSVPSLPSPPSPTSPPSFYFYLNNY